MDEVTKKRKSIVARQQDELAKASGKKKAGIERPKKDRDCTSKTNEKRTEGRISHGLVSGPWGCHCLSVMGVAETQMLLQAHSGGPWTRFAEWTATLRQRRRGPRHSSAKAQGALLHQSLPGHEEPAKEPWRLRRSWWGIVLSGIVSCRFLRGWRLKIKTIRWKTALQCREC